MLGLQALNTASAYVVLWVGPLQELGECSHSEPQTPAFYLSFVGFSLAVERGMTIDWMCRRVWEGKEGMFWDTLSHGWMDGWMANIVITTPLEPRSLTDRSCQAQGGLRLLYVFP